MKTPYSKLLPDSLLDWVEPHAPVTWAAFEYAEKLELRADFRVVDNDADRRGLATALDRTIEIAYRTLCQGCGIFSHETKHVSQNEAYPETLGMHHFVEDYKKTRDTGIYAMAGSYAVMSTPDRALVRCVHELDAHAYGYASESEMEPVDGEATAGRTGPVTRAFSFRIMQTGNADFYADYARQEMKIGQMFEIALRYLHTHFCTAPGITALALDHDRLIQSTSGLWPQVYAFMPLEPGELAAMRDQVHRIIDALPRSLPGDSPRPPAAAIS